MVLLVQKMALVLLGMVLVAMVFVFLCGSLFFVVCMICVCCLSLIFLPEDGSGGSRGS